MEPRTIRELSDASHVDVAMLRETFGRCVRDGNAVSPTAFACILGRVDLTGDDVADLLSTAETGRRRMQNGHDFAAVHMYACVIACLEKLEATLDDGAFSAPAAGGIA